jgi:hypothetical protein
MTTLPAEPEIVKRIARRPEHRLLLLCARTRVGAVEAERVRNLVAGGLDWDYLFNLAQRHAVLPLLYRQLKECARDAVPTVQLQKLGGKFRENATRNLLLAGKLLRISKLFEMEGVPVLAYKGPALAVSAYGNLSLRRFIDLDIIVRRQDASRAGALLKSLGFKTPYKLTPAREKLLFRTQHNLAFTRDGGRMIVELHWDVAAKLFAAAPLEERVWLRAARSKLNGGEVWSLSTEDLLLALCIHGTKHLWERLAWVCDVAELLNSHTNLDWELIFKQASDSHVERMLTLGLRLASELLGSSLPERARRHAYGDSATAELSAEVSRRLFDGAEYRPAGFVESIKFNLRARRRLREKCRYFRFIFTPTDGDLASLSLPDNLIFMYYLWRPFRLLWKGRAGH